MNPETIKRMAKICGAYFDQYERQSYDTEHRTAARRKFIKYALNHEAIGGLESRLKELYEGDRYGRM